MYNNYKYIYPPRPETKISTESLIKFDTGKYLGQPKLNGSSMELFTDGNIIITMNRHKEAIQHKLSIEELKNLHRGKGWMILCGEYMNKNQKDENNKPWNIKFVIWDIIVYEGNHLIGTTYEERYELLRKLYPDNPVKKYLHQISENCFRIHSVLSGFVDIFNEISKYQMYEGEVLKLREGKLENGTTKMNNMRTQLKCRKATKNYAF